MPGPSGFTNTGFKLHPAAKGENNMMRSALMPAPCPHLPAAATTMSHRCLGELNKHTPGFYFKALQYGQYLWLNGHAGRAILAVTRALYADLAADELILQEWPLPYAALSWIVANHPGNDFPGNPRISFQHQATRLRGPRQEQRRARAWAVWALVCQQKPELPGDPAATAAEPTLERINQLLHTHGHPCEAALWRSSCRSHDIKQIA